MSKKTSQRKIEANRRNALRSTGPKTAEGRAIVSKNAVKHGLLAEGILMTAGEGAEDPQEYAVLLAGLREYYGPIGLQEDLLVQEIANCVWKTRRANRAETGEIRRRLDTARADLVLEDVERMNASIQFLPLEEAKFDLCRTGVGIRYMLGILDKALPELDGRMTLSTETLENLKKHFGPQLGRMVAQSPVAAGDNSPAPVTHGEDTRQALLDRHDQLEKLLPQAEEQDRLRAESRISSCHLPSAPVLNKLLRYQTAINRQMHRAMAQLERLQRQRRGELVPPAVRIEFAG